MKSYWEFNYGEEGASDLVNKGQEFWTNHVAPALQQLAQGSKDLKNTVVNTRQTVKHAGGLIDDVKKTVAGGEEGEEEAEKAKEEAEKAKEEAHKGWSTGAKVAAGVAGAAAVGGAGYMLGRN